MAKAITFDVAEWIGGGLVHTVSWTDGRSATYSAREVPYWGA